MTAVRLHVASAGNEFMSHIAGIFVDGFRAEGVLCDLVVDGFPLDAVAPGTLDVVVAPHSSPAAFPAAPAHHRTGTDAGCRRLAERRATGQPVVRHRMGVRAPGAPGVRHQPERRRGVRAAWRTCGSHAARLRAIARRSGIRDAPSTRPVDVLFFGAVSRRRGAFFARHGQFFAGVRAELHLASAAQPAQDGSPGYLSGGDRQRHLSRSRIILGVHSDARDYFEQHRALLALASGALLVTKPAAIRRRSRPAATSSPVHSTNCQACASTTWIIRTSSTGSPRRADCRQILDAGAAQLPGHAGGRRLKAVDRCADRTGATRLAARADCRERPPAATRRHPVDDVAERTRQRHGQTRRFSRGDRLQLRTLSPALPREPCLGDVPPGGVELVVVDDASTDGSAGVAEAFMATAGLPV